MESVAHISMNEREINEELQTLKKKGPIKKSNSTEEEKMDCSPLNGNCQC